MCSRYFFTFVSPLRRLLHVIFGLITIISGGGGVLHIVDFVSKEKKKDNQILGWKLTQLSSWLNWVLLSPSSFHLSKLIVTIFMQFSSHWNQVLQFSSYERAAAVIIQLACYVNHVMSDLHKYQHNILIPQPQSHTCTDLHTHSPSPTHPHNMSNDITFHLKCSQYNF